VRKTYHSIGFPISHLENEYRRTILPKDISNIEHPENLYFESGYGEVMGIPDSAYEECGCHVVSHEEVLGKDVICDPKIGASGYLDDLQDQIIFGWVHATENRDVTDSLIRSRLSAFAWEKMYDHGRHVFWRNNELAGEAAVLHGFQCYGRMPYETKCAVIGRGNTAKGAVRILNCLGAEVTQYNRRTVDLLRNEIGDYDVIVNCVLWDPERSDHLIYRQDLKNMKPDAMIIDVSCDRGGAIETSIPTTIEDPVYRVDGVLHYVVDHTPSLYYKTFTDDVSKLIPVYLNQLVSGQYGKVLQDALIVKDGKILDQEILDVQNRTSCSLPYRPEEIRAEA
jgi:N5-(carboxyethyl)ornithine synthase